jgi:hypothetical protein
MLAIGDSIPDVSVWMGPQERVSLRELAAEKPLLLVFDLFDWSRSQ